MEAVLVLITMGDNSTLRTAASDCLFDCLIFVSTHDEWRSWMLVSFLQAI